MTLHRNVLRLASVNGTLRVSDAVFCPLPPSQVVSFMDVPLSSRSLEEILYSDNPIKNFRPGQQYAVPVYGSGLADGQIQGFLISEYVEINDDHYVQVMPPTGGRAEELLRLREDERKRRIQRQILEKQQKLKQIKTENTSYTYFEVALTKKKKMNLLFKVTHSAGQ